MPRAHPYYSGLHIRSRTLGTAADPQFYSRAQWRHVRALVLARDPLCADPYAEHEEHGEVVPATDVHHISSRAWSPQAALDLQNLQALCHSCHSRLTRTETGGGIR